MGRTSTKPWRGVTGRHRLWAGCPDALMQCTSLQSIAIRSSLCVKKVWLQSLSVTTCSSESVSCGTRYSDTGQRQPGSSLQLWSSQVMSRNCAMLVQQSVFIALASPVFNNDFCCCQVRVLLQRCGFWHKDADLSPISTMEFFTNICDTFNSCDCDDASFGKELDLRWIRCSLRHCNKAAWCSHQNLVALKLLT